MTNSIRCARCGIPRSDASAPCPGCLLQAALPLPEADPPRAGEKFGDYELVERIARGGMGVVYRARKAGSDHLVAIKLLLGGELADEGAQLRFQAEAHAAALLEHPNIVPIYDFGWHGQQPFIVMRYMAGGTLEQRMKNGQLKLTETAHIFKRIADALDAAHARQIVHRDVKPSNILFDADGEAFLSDFGIAKSLKVSEEEEWLVGTPAYMSPEQATGDSLDGCSDTYSLGIILYEILTGRLPFSGDSATSLINARVNMPVPNIRSVQANVPSVWQEVVGKALARNPADRYQTVGDFARDVQEIVSGRWYLRKL